MHPAVPACPRDSKHKWSKKFKEFLANTLIKDFEARPRALALMEDPFLKEVIYILHSARHLLCRVISVFDF